MTPAPRRLPTADESTDGRLRTRIQALEAELALVRVLSGGIAHDFNNLLTGVLGNLDLVLEDLSSTSHLRAPVERAVQASKRAADLTRQMLAYSGRGQAAVGDVDLSELVEDAARAFRTAMPKTVALNLRLEPRMPWVHADAVQVRQVVTHLLTNACEAVGDRVGAITVTTGAQACDRKCLSRSRIDRKPEPGLFAWLAVSDTGCGMDEETRARLFDPSFTTKFRGRGLGMSAVLSIVGNHGGVIIVESEPGRGSTVLVMFPVAGPRAASRADQPTAGKAGPQLVHSSPAGTVLVVDDEEQARSVCETMLRRAGYRTVSAASGEQGLAVFRERPGDFDCVLLDLTMPGLDGLATFEALRSIRDDVKVILCTGWTDQAVTDERRWGGLSGFLQKPYRLQQLRTEVARVLGSSREG